MHNPDLPGNPDKAESSAPPSTPYDVIVVDPPWAYGSSDREFTVKSVAERHYQTIGNKGKEINRRTGAGTEAIIASAPVAEWAAKNAHLYLWTTNPKLPFAFAVMEAWGFVYKTTLTWTKVASSGRVQQGGMGWFFRGATEHVLFGVRGSLPIPSGKRESNVIAAGLGEHSEKPQAFYDLVDRVSPAGARKLDVFGRKTRAGWDVWGNEVGYAPTQATMFGASGDVQEATPLTAATPDGQQLGIFP